LYDLNVEEYRDLEIKVKGHSLCEFMHDLWTSLKSLDPGLYCCWWHGYIIIHVCITSPGNSYRQRKVVRYGCSKSFDVVEIDTSRKPMCDS